MIEGRVKMRWMTYFGRERRARDGESSLCAGQLGAQFRRLRASLRDAGSEHERSRSY